MRSLLADCSLDDRQRFITIPTPMPTRALVRKLTRPLCLIRNRFWTGLLQPSILAGFHTLTLMVVPSSNFVLEGVMAHQVEPPSFSFDGTSRKSAKQIRSPKSGIGLVFWLGIEPLCFAFDQLLYPPTRYNHSTDITRVEQHRMDTPTTIEPQTSIL